VLILLSFPVQIVWANLAAELNVSSGLFILTAKCGTVVICGTSIARMSVPTLSSLALSAAGHLIILDTVVICQVGAE
jgi:hypothetical protein